MKKSRGCYIKKFISESLTPSVPFAERQFIIMNNKFFIPKPTFTEIKEGSFEFVNPVLVADNCDSRVIKETNRLFDTYADKNQPNVGELVIRHDVQSTEEYSLTVDENGILIVAKSSAGAFYGLQTLKQLLMQGKTLPYVEIHDKPEFSYRGFYHDVTRGRIPTLETLKKLVDKIASYKINVLQLYVEHAFAFAEYAEINEGQEPLTAEEIKELDSYCKERFVELIPSLACFGHLYRLLQNEKYSHLCELENFNPQQHHWVEEGTHHTIDVSNPESYELVKSLIEQYMPLFSSQYFNICCDETFDLGKGRNDGKNVGELYTDFISKIISLVESKGKTAMLWGDIILHHIDLVDKISDKAVFLNWEYEKNVNFAKIEAFRNSGREQIVCPGVKGWIRLLGHVPISEVNIRKMAAYGKICGAKGVMTTNWGDYGHFCDPLNVSFGTALGAAESWNPAGASNEYFDNAVSILVYQNPSGNVLKAVREICNCDGNGGKNIFLGAFRALEKTKGLDDGYIAPELSDLLERSKRCDKAAEIFEINMQNNQLDKEIGEALISAARGNSLLLLGVAIECRDYKMENWFSMFKKWQRDFEMAWIKQNKKDDLPIASAFLDEFGEMVLKKAL